MLRAVVKCKMLPFINAEWFSHIHGRTRISMKHRKVHLYISAKLELLLNRQGGCWVRSTPSCIFRLFPLNPHNIMVSSPSFDLKAKLWGLWNSHASSCQWALYRVCKYPFLAVGVFKWKALCLAGEGLTPLRLPSVNLQKGNFSSWKFLLRQHPVY